MGNPLLTRCVHRPRRGVRRTVFWATIAIAWTLVQCEHYYYAVSDTEVVPRFTSEEAGTMMDTQWTVTGRAANGDSVRRFYVDFYLHEFKDVVDTAAAVDSADSVATEVTIPTVTRVTLELDDGTHSSLDYSSEDSSNNYLYLTLPNCTIPDADCTYTVRLRMEALTSGPIMLDTSIVGSISVNPGCANEPTKEDVAGLSLTIDPLPTE